MANPGEAETNLTFDRCPRFIVNGKSAISAPNYLKQKARVTRYLHAKARATLAQTFQRHRDERD